MKTPRNSLFAVFVCIPCLLFSEGSKNLNPNSSGGVATGTNDFIGYLEHDAVFGGGAFNSTNFFDPQAPVNERVKIYIRDGETLYWGLRRIVMTAGASTHQQLTVALFEEGATPGVDTPVATWLLDDDEGTTDNATFVAGAGVIQTAAQALAGPSTIVGGSGYNAASYTNNTGSDQDFFVVFVQVDGGPNAGYTNDIDVRSWYDVWDFSVYDGSEEKPGRMHSALWNFTAAAAGNLLSTEFQMFAQIPSTIGGSNAGNYIKEIDLQGLDPFSVLVYANSTGADIGSVTDTNNDGTIDFQDARQSQDTDIGAIEYEMFLNNPDIDLYPTTTLPTIDITDAVFFCNNQGNGGEGTIYFNTNQTGFIAVLVDLNGTSGYQDGTADIIIEQEVVSEGDQVIRWDGIDGTGAYVTSGTEITITGRFTAGPLHVPLFDVEANGAGIQMLDVRPSTSFDLIYWDDSPVPAVGSSPTVELDGTNTATHLWADGDEELINTWSYGFFQVNSQIINFTFVCDSDGDGIDDQFDLDSDNDGVADSVEGDFRVDTDGDQIPDYVDNDFAGFVDANGDGVNDNFDTDFDGIPDAIDLDSDNDGIPDIIEFGLTDANNDGTLDEGSGITDLNGNGLDDAYDPDCTGAGSSGSGDASDGGVFSSTGWTNPANAADAGNNSGAFSDTPGSTLVMDMGATIPAGQDLTIRLAGLASGQIMSIEQSPDGTDFTNGNLFNFVPQNVGFWENITYTLNADGRYIRFTVVADPGGDFLGVDGLSYNYTITACAAASALSIPDTDGDGVDDYLDLDSDNDGIVDVFEAGGTAGADGRIGGFTDSNGNGRNDTQDAAALSIPDTDADGTLADFLDIDSDNDGIEDNREGQSSDSYIASAAGDTDGNGLLDVYDPNNGGTLITPVDTDGDTSEDYQDTDADDDGVADIIEGHDANIDGFGDWDSNSNNVLETADFAGFDSDGDGDGLWNVFDTDNSGTAAVLQNTDGADLSDWQDTDDDNDTQLTAGEDANSNGDWTDDKTQGQGGGATVPDYLYRGDYDGDAIADAADADSDNDGITDADEDGSESVDPSGDEDADGIPNYRDDDDTGVTDNIVEVDSNGDGVWDNYDTDLDGVPDFLDLDSDNDGIWDAVEADAGSVPFGLDTSTGQFTLDDPDNDGLMNFVDTDDVTATNPTSDLSNPDSDGDGINDFLDIDSDGDGITDIIEAQTTSGFLALSNSDSDGDGIDDTFDANSGGTLIEPVNSDGVDLQDYLDTDSDNDNVEDIIEGDDADNDGVGEWDDNSNGTADEADFSTDSDGDGLADAFDNVTLGTAGNETGSSADLQNTDGIDFRDWRDDNDDNDDALTANEDANSNGDYSDDQTNGQSGSIPDYLFNGDKDNDGIADAADADSDNDGILDTDEDGGETVDPSLDADGDGIPNYRDSDDPGVINNIVEVDSNGDGVWDNYDQDLDGIPDFLDLDSDNDGIPDLLETSNGVDTDGDGKVDGLDDSDNDGLPDNVDVDATGGVDSDGDGIDDAFDFSISGGTDTDGDDIIDSADLDIDGDGLANTYDTDNGGTAIIVVDTDGDGLNDFLDLDSDDDGITDITEAGGGASDTDGDGEVDDTTDTDSDGHFDAHDPDNSGTVLARPDSDNDGIIDLRDVDSDNDGITDPVEAGGADTDNDGRIDGNSTDTDGDGLADTVDPDNSGTPISGVDTDGDGLADYLDLDSDNDGFQDILEAGGTDADNDGLVDTWADSDGDGIVDAVDVTNSGTNGGSGIDTDADGIDNTFDVDQTGGNDTDGDSIDNTFDNDSDGNGFDDDTELTPFTIQDTDGDGNSNFRDRDADNDGVIDVLEFGLTADGSNGDISGFTDANTNGWNDAQEAAVITPVDSDSDPFSIPDYLDLDSDDDGIVDNFESQTKATYITITGNDTDDDGLDDAYDPDNGGTLVTPVNTDGTGSDDILDGDSDDDNVPDNHEGDNAIRDQFADWDTDQDGNFDDTGFDTDVDEDGILDIFDTFSGTGSAQVTGSGSAVQDTDVDGVWDFQDTDDDDDGRLTASTGAGGEDVNSNSDPTDDINDDPDATIPDFLFGNDDPDGDGVVNSNDGDSDNDGLADTSEDGGTGIDPSGDIDGDGLANYEDEDIDGDGVLNTSESGTFALADDNSDGVLDAFDYDLDGVPDFLDLDSDNDGIADVVELGLTDSDEDGTLDEGSGLTDANGNGFEDQYDPGCVNVTGGTFTGNATSVFSETGLVLASTNATGASDDTGTFLDDVTDELVLQMDATILGGQNIDVINQTFSGASNGQFLIDQSTDGTNFENAQVLTTTSIGTFTTGTYTLTADALYIRIRLNVDPGNFHGIDALEYDYTVAGGNPCAVTGVAVTPADTDSDGIPDYQDIDSDNDGIVDNVEAQASATYVAPVDADADGDGLFDVYDEDVAVGNALAPINTDATGSADYLDADADDDGVDDNIEGFDSDQDGFAAWDTDNDNDIADEVGQSVDLDSDGLWDIYDTNSGIGSVANITGSSSTLQDTDADATPDFRDTDDDDDGIATNLEDTNTNSNFADDFTQGGGSTPNYLFDPDVDGDNVLDQNDADSDNDGVLNTDEYNSAVYASSGTPFDDADGDGIYNYLDDADVNNTSFTDANGDGVDDQVDEDRDGVPNFFDLDSDNDGILDAIEANDGAVPSNFSTTTGRFSNGDSDSDGIDNEVDPSTGGTALNKDDFDSDGVDDYLDLDTDDDGITDNIEAQLTSSYIAPTTDDTDEDGLADVYDANNSGTAIVPTNTDAAFTISDTEPDYRDVDADNDNDGIGFVGDEIEGFDANRNGFSDLDTNQNLDLSDESGAGADTDGDGLQDIFDTFSGRGLNNINGSRQDLQDTDGDGTLDFRDQDDDEDNISTAVEDVDSDGNWTNDKVQGGGATPDYLFFNDSDNDKVADGQDADGDNDGIPDSDEYDATVYRNPFGDQDGDGVFNYNDSDNPNALDGTTPLTDTNGDGIWDEYDTDLDGVPNFFDLDSDNDGIQDILEAGGTDSDNNGRLDGTDDTDDDGIFDNVDVDSAPGNGGSGVDTDGDDIDDTFDVDETGGTDADGDSIDDTFDLDDDGDGIIETIDPDEGGAALTDGDFDGDGLVNRIDLDSDSDGLVDLIEARGSDTDGDGQLDTAGDTDGDGWGNLVDSDDGGTPLPLPNTDGTDDLDYLDRDADDDGEFDFNEGFDDDEDGEFTDDYADRATAYGNASEYSPVDLVWYTNDDDADNLPNFLDPNSGRFVDDDADGIINLFDVDAGGDFYGNVSGKPDIDGDGTEDYIDLDGDFSVTPTSVTTGEDGTNDSFDVVLTLQPDTDVVLNISESSDEISLSATTLTFTNSDWNMAQSITVNGLDDALNDGAVAYTITVSVSDALSDDNFDSADDQVVSGTNLDDEGSIVVSTNAVTTGEDGTNNTFDVELSVAPTTDVVINISESSDEGSLSASSLTFDNTNWNVAQTVTITAADDALLDGDQGYNITLTVDDPASDDAFDDAVDEIIAVTNVDDEQGVILSTTAVTTSEAGTTGSFTVVLDAVPSTNVVIDLSEISDEGGLSATSLTFMPGDFDTPQLVTITPADDVDPDGNQVYDVTVSVNAGSDATYLAEPDQTVTVTNEDDETTPLPLDFLSFTGEPEDEGIRLKWVTINEVNVEKLILEGSQDGETFQELIAIPGTNDKELENLYQYLDRNPTVGLNYYRVKQVDFDGAADSTGIISIHWGEQAIAVSVYPNPVTRMMTIQSNGNFDGSSYKIYDTNGRVMLQGNFEQLGNEARLDLSALEPGMYFLQTNISSDSGIIRIIKR